MTTNIFTRQVLAMLAASIMLFIGACEKSGPDTPAVGGDTAAERENVEAMSREHAEDSTKATAAALTEPRRAVVSENLAYAEVGDELVYGHFSFPADMVEPLPAIIVIHEWWGLNDNVRATADRLAGEGYIVLALDLFGGETGASAEEARNLMTKVVENPEAAAENIRSAFEFVSQTGGATKVGSLGWCFGGGWSLNTALLLPDDLDAAVIYYGRVIDDEERLRTVNAPILGHFGALDQGIPVDSVERFETALEYLGKDHEIHIYADADHAFANPTGDRYNAEAAELAWKRTIEFLAANLGSADES